MQGGKASGSSRRLTGTAGQKPLAEGRTELWRLTSPTEHPQRAQPPSLGWVLGSVLHTMGNERVKSAS